MRVALTRPLSAKEITESTGATRKNSSDFIISHISTDSRNICQGDLFIPLSGQKNDGECYIAEAIGKGAFIMSAIDVEADFLVKNTREALLSIGEYYKQQLPKLKHTVAITGSVGKTTTKEFLRSILGTTFNTHATSGNENNDIGVPLTILRAPIETEILILECGMNHRGELSKLSTCIKPDISIITNIGTAHIGNLGSRSAIADAKLEICYGMSGGVLLCESDEPLLYDAPFRKTISFDGSRADYGVIPGTMNDGMLSFDFLSSEVRIKNILFPTPAKHLLEPLGMAIAVALEVGMSCESIKSGVANLPSDLARHRFIECGDFTILDDSYNASMESVKAALDMLSSFKSLPRSALLGDILESGDYAEQIHRKVGAYAASCGLRKLYIFGEFSRYTAKGAIESGMRDCDIHINTCINNTLATAKAIADNHVANEIILFKASHGVKLNRIIDVLKGCN